MLATRAIMMFDDTVSVVRVISRWTDFYQHESCGKCTPCRVGTAQAALLMQTSKWNQPLLRELAEVMVDASICGLGQAAPNPMRSVMNYFAHELETD